MNKVIVILECFFGHVEVVQWNADNAIRLLESVMAQNGPFWNFDNDDPECSEETANELIAAQNRDQQWLDRVEAFLNGNFGGRSRGNLINVVSPTESASRQDFERMF